MRQVGRGLCERPHPLPRGGSVSNQLGGRGLAVGRGWLAQV